MRQHLRPTLEDRDTAGKTKIAYGSREKLDPAPHRVEQDQALVRPGLGEDKSRHSATRPEIEDGTFNRSDELRHREGVTHMVRDRSGSKESELAGHLQRLDETRAHDPT